MNCNEPLIINTKPVDEPFDQAKLVELYNTIGKLEATIDDLNADLGGCEAHIEELEEILTGVKKVLDPVYSQTLVSAAEALLRQHNRHEAHIEELEAKLSNTTFVASVDRHSSEIQEACEECEKFGSSAADGLAFAITRMGLWVVSGRAENAKLKRERDRYSDAIFTTTARMKATLSDEYTSGGVNRGDVLCDGFEGALDAILTQLAESVDIEDHNKVVSDRDEYIRSLKDERGDLKKQVWGLAKEAREFSDILGGISEIVGALNSDVLEAVTRLKHRADVWQKVAEVCQKASREQRDIYQSQRVRNVLRRALGRVLGGGQ